MRRFQTKEVAIKRPFEVAQMNESPAANGIDQFGMHCPCSPSLYITPRKLSGGLYVCSRCGYQATAEDVRRWGGPYPQKYEPSADDLRR